MRHAGSMTGTDKPLRIRCKTVGTEITMTEHKNSFEYKEATQAEENIYTAEDAETGKTMAGLSHFLFFLPLLTCSESKYAKLHANQSLLLLITAIAGNMTLCL
jgi:hypothetical protein